LDRVFLDANVLFSSAYAPDNRFLALWEASGLRLLTSDYALEEARRNLTGSDRLERFRRLMMQVEVVSTSSDTLSAELAFEADLPAKDRPILAAAVEARATHLLTGDVRHFGDYFGRRIRGVLIQTPSQYLRAKSK